MKALSVITADVPARIFLAAFIIALLFGSFSGGMFAAIGICSGIALFVATSVFARKIPLPDIPLASAIAAILLLLLFTSAYGISPDRSWQMTLRLASVTFPLLLLSPATVAVQTAKCGYSYWWPPLFVIGMVILGMDMFLDHPLLRHLKNPILDGDTLFNKYNRGFSYVILMGFVVGGACFVHHGSRRGTTLLLALVAVTVAPLMMTSSGATQAAFLAAAATTAMAAIFPRFTYAAAWCGFPLAVAWPFIARLVMESWPEALVHLPASWRARTEIWDYMSYRISEQPWTGWGIGSSKLLSFASPHSGLYTITSSPASHPHNAAIQLWVETGIPGLTLGLAIAAILLINAWKLSDRKLVPFAIGAWVYAWCLGMTAYDLWSDSLLSALALTAFSFAVLKAQPQKHKTC